MRELEASTPPELRAFEIGLNDILLKVLSPAKRGRTREFGFGVTRPIHLDYPFPRRHLNRNSR